jgi:hypothetical protein
MNPYESPLSECDPPSQCSAKSYLRGAWLVFASLLLAIFIEVFPTETDVLVVGKLSGRGIVYLLAVKAIFLAIIITPLLIYFLINGRRGLQTAKGRITTIGIIIAANIVMNLFIFFIESH